MTGMRLVTVTALLSGYLRGITPPKEWPVRLVVWPISDRCSPRSNNNLSMPNLEPPPRNSGAVDFYSRSFHLVTRRIVLRWANCL